MQVSSIKASTSALLTMQKTVECVDHNKLWKVLKEMGIPDHLNCLLRNLHADQEATVRERDSYVCVCVCVYIHMLLLLLLSTLLRIATCLFNL